MWRKLFEKCTSFNSQIQTCSLFYCFRLFFFVYHWLTTYCLFYFISLPYFLIFPAVSFPIGFLLSYFLFVILVLSTIQFHSFHSFYFFLRFLHSWQLNFNTLFSSFSCPIPHCVRTIHQSTKAFFPRVKSHNETSRWVIELTFWMIELGI